MTKFQRFLAVTLLLWLAGCASTPSGKDCPAGTQKLPDCPPLGAIEDPFITSLYWQRLWQSGDEHQVDVVDVGVDLDIPEQNARAKFLGARSEDALNSLAAKIWMIENAEHTIDATYYIFKRDLIGEAMLGALCNAVQRGVDIRFMVDSVGSIDSTHSGLKALETCADDAGFMRNAQGQLTTKKARIQVVVFNAVSNVFVKRQVPGSGHGDDRRAQRIPFLLRHQCGRLSQPRHLHGRRDSAAYRPRRGPLPRRSAD